MSSFFRRRSKKEKETTRNKYSDDEDDNYNNKKNKKRGGDNRRGSGDGGYVSPDERNYDKGGKKGKNKYGSDEDERDQRSRSKSGGDRDRSRNRYGSDEDEREQRSRSKSGGDRDRSKNRYGSDEEERDQSSRSKSGGNRDRSRNRYGSDEEEDSRGRSRSGNRGGNDNRDDRGGRNSRGGNRSDEEERGRSRSRGRQGGPDYLQRFDSIQDPGKKFLLKDCIGSGVCGDVYEAIDEEAGNRRVAIKIQKLTPESQPLIVEEYRVLRDLSEHQNLPDFFGVYRRRSGKKTEYDQIWFVMQFCEGGTVIDLVKGLQASDKRMQEEHIAYILKETTKALIFLHENNVMHRDVRASNIMLTKEGEVKLVDFGLSRMTKGEGRRHTSIGSPNWMAPEVCLSKSETGNGYTNRADVWALGITAIEIADGKPPFQDMHPTRALFQIVRNPPPQLYRPSNWSQNFNDFIAECLEKNPENRPLMVEVAEHPFLSESVENEYMLSQEIKSLSMNYKDKGKRERKPEVIVRKGYLKNHQTMPPERMFTEDLSALEQINEDNILDELQERLLSGSFHTFIGDILLICNPNETQDIYNMNYHTKYQCKSRSDNTPHIYSVADSAYQDLLHHEEPQHILFAGESNSGKTTNMIHVIEHLMYLGKSLKDNGNKVLKAINLLHAFTNAATPLNPNSTRCVFQIQTTYGSTGRASGAIFWIYQLEKWRVSTKDKNQSNFHIFYYLYDYLESTGSLRQYQLPSGRRMRYLRTHDLETNGRRRSFKVRNDPTGNIKKFETFKECLKLMEMDENLETICRILSAILNIGDIRFVEGNSGGAEVHTIDTANTAAELLGIDPKKFSWSLCNFCVVKKGVAVKKKYTISEAKEIRDVLANTIYQRLVDWIVNNINQRLSITRTLFGDKYLINVLDLYGFECFSSNKLEQVIVNTMNEQLQCHYNQRIFSWEMQELQEEGLADIKFHYYDNRQTINQLMGKDEGFFFILDEASKQLRNSEYILDRLEQRQSETNFIKVISPQEFTVAHYTGKITYDASEISEKNRDFISPELVETLRQTTKPIVKQLFFNKLSKSGNLTIQTPDENKPRPKERKQAVRSKWSAILVQETTTLRKYNTEERGQYSQSKKMRTCAATFRSSSLEILKSLCVGGESGGTHFVRCIRSDLEGTPRGFNREVVRQQLRALSIVDTAKARQKGYPYRMSFQEFLRRYKFLAFDFDENVEMTVENCRLLLIRLKMEGWVIGKTKVFLKYYNEEYLSRLYETQVKKIIKVQCMMRSFLARKSLATKNQKSKYAPKSTAPTRASDDVKGKCFSQTKSVQTSQCRYDEEKPDEQKYQSKYVARRRSISPPESLPWSRSSQGTSRELGRGNNRYDEVLCPQMAFEKHIPSPPPIPRSPIPGTSQFFSASASLQPSICGSSEDEQ